MKVIISPAKKMNEKPDLIEELTLPVFEKEAKELGRQMKSLPYETLKKILGCNDKIAELNYRRYQDMDFKTGRIPALLAYEGLQYQHMAPSVFTEEEWTYVQANLYILSGLYGILRPMDRITPYRLEMQTKLETKQGNQIYDYWRDSIYKELSKGTTTIINLASKEYSKVIEAYLEPQMQYITCVFGEYVDGKVKVKGTQAKMARGEMVRFMCVHHVESLEQLKRFKGLDFLFSAELSNERNYVFLKKS